MGGVDTGVTLEGMWNFEMTGQCPKKDFESLENYCSGPL